MQWFVQLRGIPCACCCFAYEWRGKTSRLWLPLVSAGAGAGRGAWVAWCDGCDCNAMFRSTSRHSLYMVAALPLLFLALMSLGAAAVWMLRKRSGGATACHPLLVSAQCAGASSLPLRASFAASLLFTPRTGSPPAPRRLRVSHGPRTTVQILAGGPAYPRSPLSGGSWVQPCSGRWPMDNAPHDRGRRQLGPRLHRPPLCAHW